MSILSMIAYGYETGRYEWLQNIAGDTKQDMVDNPDRTPAFCPLQAVATLSGARYDRIAAQRTLREAARGLGYANYQLYNDEEGRTLNEVLDTLRAADAELPKQ